MKQKIGLNMFSLRDLCKDQSGLNKTFGALYEMGYRYVQISGLGELTTGQISSALKDSGLKACATHMSWEDFRTKTDEAIETHKLYGTTHAAIGGLPGEYRSPAGVERFVTEAASIIPKLQDAGLDFSYHNHKHEFVRSDRQTWIDLLYEKGAEVGIHFELDTYWVAAAGADPADYIGRFGESMSIVHVKDMIITREGEQRFAPVGVGNLNWQRIFETIRHTPIEFVIIEQDGHYDADPLVNVADSLAFLRAAGFATEEE